MNNANNSMTAKTTTPTDAERIARLSKGEIRCLNDLHASDTYLGQLACETTLKRLNDHRLTDNVGMLRETGRPFIRPNRLGKRIAAKVRAMCDDGTMVFTGRPE